MHSLSKKLFCIQYPGDVKNPPAAIKSLGGIEAISAMNKDNVSKKRRLDLRFRPDDPYCKPMHADRHSAKGLVLKIKFKKSKGDAEDAPKKIVSSHVVGVVNQIYKFDRMVDFQFLPAERVGDETKSLLDDLVPTGIPHVEWFNRSQNLFLPPPFFSRLDTPQNYDFRLQPVKNQEDESANSLLSRRKKRYTYAHIVSFNHVDPIPTDPQKNAIEFLQTCKKDSYESIKKLFDERPVWSKVELLAVTNVKNIELKHILPLVAYYFTSGPWRVLWVRLGYDPRKIPSSRIYQNIDFRLRTTCGLKNRMIFEKRLGHDPDKKFSMKKEKNYIFRQGYLPPMKQMFYQYCNLKVSGIEEQLSNLGEVLPGALCHERRGWLPVGFEDKCRDFLTNCVMDTLKEESNFATTSTYEMDDDDEEDDNADNMEGLEESDSDEA